MRPFAYIRAGDAAAAVAEVEVGDRQLVVDLVVVAGHPKRAIGILSCGCSTSTGS